MSETEAILQALSVARRDRKELLALVEDRLAKQDAFGRLNPEDAWSRRARAAVAMVRNAAELGF